MVPVAVAPSVTSFLLHRISTCTVCSLELKAEAANKPQLSDTFACEVYCFVGERLCQLIGQNGEASVQGEKLDKPLVVQQQPW